MTTRNLLMGVLASLACGSGLAAERVVSTTAELESSLASAARGLIVRLKPGEYLIERTLAVPDGVQLVGEARMGRDDQGVPTGLEPSSAVATLRLADNFAGDLVTLGDGASLHRLQVAIPARVRDGQSVAAGNSVVIASRRPGDRVAASLSECEVGNDSVAGFDAEGPLGRGVTLITRNPADQPAHEGAHLSVRVEDSLLRAPFGHAVFINNFAARGRIDFAIERSLVEGTSGISGGTSRPDLVHDAHGTYRSVRTRYRPARGGNDGVGLMLFAASGNPFELFEAPPQGAERVTSRFESFGDRIEGYRTGVLATGYRRVADFSGPGRDNRLELDFRDTTIVTPDHPESADLALTAVTSNPPLDGALVLPAGERNLIVARFSGVRGSGERANRFLDRAGPPAVLVDGDRNRVQIEGSPAEFALSNPGLRPLPPASAFTRPD